MTTVDLIIRRRNQPTPRGYRYDVLLADELLVTGYDPEFMACRLLAERGITGKARFWREGKAHHDIEMDITKASQRCVRETQNHGPRLAKWKPNDWFKNREDDEPEKLAEAA